MRIINDYYVIGPEDSLEEIKYLMNLGCKVLGYFRAGIHGIRLYYLIYNRFGEKIEKLKFKEYNKTFFGKCNSYFYVKW